jgi:hypothetical protein
MLYLTYNVGLWVDGLGSQYQKIIGIITIAMKYNIEYVHTKITIMDHVKTPEYLQKISDFFQIEYHYKSVNDYKYDEVFEEENPTDDIIKKYIDKSKKSNILLKILKPHNIVFNNDTTLLNKSIKLLRTYLKMPELPYYNNISSDIKKIAIHIRRGDVDPKKYPDRFIPIEKYISIVDKFNEIYPNNKIFIITEINEKNINEFDIITKNNKYNNVKILANIDIIESLGYMIKADILVACKSSFSYIPAIYNQNKVYYIDFWHKPLDNWINIKELLNTNTIEKFTNSNTDYTILFLIVLLLILLYIIYKFFIKS